MRNTLLLGAAFALLSTTASVAMPVVYAGGAGGDGFAYEVVFTNANYAGAVTAAQARTFNGVNGNLAVLTSEAQVRFILGLANGPYTAFANGLGDGTDFITNSAAFGRGAVDLTAFSSFSGTAAPTLGNALTVRRTNATGVVANGNVTIASGDATNSIAYIVQYAIPVPVPASLPLAATGLGVLALIARRRAKAKGLKAA
jgi:hypothetical protein